MSSLTTESNFEKWLQRDRDLHPMRSVEDLEARVYCLYKNLLHRNMTEQRERCFDNNSELTSAMSSLVETGKEMVESLKTSRPPEVLTKKLEQNCLEAQELLDEQKQKERLKTYVRIELEKWMGDILHVDDDIRYCESDDITESQFLPVPDEHFIRNQECIPDEEEEYPETSIVQTKPLTRKRRRLSKENPFLPEIEEIPAPLPDDPCLDYVKLLQNCKRRKLN